VQTLEDNERDYIMSVLKGVDGNKNQAAKIMNIDRVSLWRKLLKDVTAQQHPICTRSGWFT
jgi:transcriptional regulator with PAS, ATPase and Fis domain